MSPLDQATIATPAVAAAIVITVLSIVLSAAWRPLKRWWARFTWTPRLTPGIRAEVIMVMGEDGHVGIQFEKLTPEDNASEVFSLLTEQWFKAGASMGVNVNWSSKIGAVIDTPEGREYVVALVRPVKATDAVRLMSESERDALEGQGGAPVTGGRQ